MDISAMKFFELSCASTIHNVAWTDHWLTPLHLVMMEYLKGHRRHLRLRRIPDNWQRFDSRCAPCPGTPVRDCRLRSLHWAASLGRWCRLFTRLSDSQVDESRAKVLHKFSDGLRGQIPLFAPRHQVKFPPITHGDNCEMGLWASGRSTSNTLHCKLSEFPFAVVCGRYGIKQPTNVTKVGEHYGRTGLHAVSRNDGQQSRDTVNLRISRVKQEISRQMASNRTSPDGGRATTAKLIWLDAGLTMASGGRRLKGISTLNRLLLLSVFQSRSHVSIAINNAAISQALTETDCRRECRRICRNRRSSMLTECRPGKSGFS